MARLINIPTRVITDIAGCPCPSRLRGEEDGSTLHIFYEDTTIRGRITVAHLYFHGVAPEVVAQEVAGLLEQARDAGYEQALEHVRRTLGLR